MKESKIKLFLRKVVREMGLWTFRNLRVFHEIRRLSIDKKNPVLIRFCDCDQCRARKIRRQFSMTQEEGFDVLAVSSKHKMISIFFLMPISRFDLKEYLDDDKEVGIFCFAKCKIVLQIIIII